MYGHVQTCACVRASCQCVVLFACTCCKFAVCVACLHVCVACIHARPCAHVRMCSTSMCLHLYACVGVRVYLCLVHDCVRVNARVHSTACTTTGSDSLSDASVKFIHICSRSNDSYHEINVFRSAGRIRVVSSSPPSSGLTMKLPFYYF